jgi:hypothetical protein
MAAYRRFGTVTVRRRQPIEILARPTDQECRNQQRGEQKILFSAL